MSQYNEHFFVLEYFGNRAGYFLDIGAGSADCKSNTVPLLEVGWSGVMVEPAISQLRWLTEKFVDDPRVEIIPAALVPESGCAVVSLWDGGDYSTYMTWHRDLIERHSSGTVKFRKRVAPTISWDCLRGKFYDFINIDVEGGNLNVLMAMPEDMTPFMVCVEMDPASAVPDMRRFLAKRGLNTQREFGGNLLAWRGGDR